MTEEYAQLLSFSGTFVSCPSYYIDALYLNRYNL